jgi:hypothetical protein
VVANIFLHIRNITESLALSQSALLTIESVVLFMLGIVP